jgi:hypothetical protein
MDELLFRGKRDLWFMFTGSDPPTLAIDDFTRRFALRATNLMWFLGAGASASAGIPTATDMVWEFKQLLFVSQRRVALQTVADLSNSAIRAQLQAHIDARTAFAASRFARGVRGPVRGCVPS